MNVLHWEEELEDIRKKGERLGGRSSLAEGRYPYSNTCKEVRMHLSLEVELMKIWKSSYLKKLKCIYFNHIHVYTF